MEASILEDTPAQPTLQEELSSMRGHLKDPAKYTNEDALHDDNEGSNIKVDKDKNNNQPFMPPTDIADTPEQTATPVA